MKHVKIGEFEFSKVICGSNPFYARSHFSAGRDAEYRGRFDDETIRGLMQHGLNLGINTVESSANARIAAIMSQLKPNPAGPIQLIGSTRIDDTSTIKSHAEKLDCLIKSRAAICVIHAQFADRAVQAASGAGLERFLDRIHEAGLLAGISTHAVKTVEVCERRGYAIDTYMFPLNLTGFVYPGYEGRETVRERIDLVRGVAKPFVLIKTLAAGRIPPGEGLPFVAEHAKPNDLVSFGFGTKEELDETVAWVGKCF